MLNLLKNDIFQKTVLFLIICFLIFVSLKQCESIDSLSTKMTQNQNALLGAMVDTKTLDGRLETQSFIFLANTKEELSKLNKDLSSQIDKIKGDVKYISDIQIRFRDSVLKKLKSDVTSKPDEKTGGTIYTSKWLLDTTQGSLYRKMSGVTMISVDKDWLGRDYGSYITSDEIGLDIITSVKKEKDGIKATVSPKYPTKGLSFNIVGAIVDKEITEAMTKTDSRFNFGVGFFFSPLAISKSYSNSSVYAGWSAGFGLTLNYSIIKF